MNWYDGLDIRYEDENGNLVICGDCLEVMKQMPDGCVDLCLTDPPYGIAGQDKGSMKGDKFFTTQKLWGDAFQDSFEDKEYSNIIAQLTNLFDVILVDDGSLLIFHDRGKAYRIKPIYDTFILRNVLVFVKTNPIPHWRKNNYRSGFEMCSWFSKNEYKFNFFNQADSINVIYGAIGRKDTKHPTEKYMWMIEPLVKKHSQEGDLVLDPFLGSGTTAIAAIKTGRRFIGIELSSEYCDLSVERIKQELAQPELAVTTLPDKSGSFSQHA